MRKFEVCIRGENFLVKTGSGPPMRAGPAGMRDSARMGPKPTRARRVCSVIFHIRLLIPHPLPLED